MGKLKTTWPRISRLVRGGSRQLPLGLGAGVGALAALVVADLVLEQPVVLAGTFVVAPFVTALIGGMRATVMVAVLTILVVAASGAWNDNFAEGGHAVRVVVAAGAGLLAVGGAWIRSRSAADARRLELLDAVGEVADGSLPLAETLERVQAVVVPEVGDMCMIDVFQDHRAVRSAVRVAPHPRRAQIERALRARPPSVPGWMIRPDSPFPRQPRFLPRMTDEDLSRLAHSEQDLAFLRQLAPRSSITVAMVARDRALGALTIVSAWSGRRYSLGDVHFTQILAGRVALALDNAGLFSDLESVERRMDNVMTLLDEAVVIHDAAGALVYANPAAARTLGFASVDELLATPPAGIGDRFRMRAEDGSPLRAGVLADGAASRGESPKPMVIRGRTKDSRDERWYVIRSKPVTGPDGRTLYSVTALEDVTEVKRAEFAQRLLARTGELLSESTDYRRTLQNVARIAVPDFADWCAVSLPGADGLVEQVAVVHSDPEKVALAKRVRTRYPARVGDEEGVGRVLRTGEPQLIDDPTEEFLRAVAHDEEHLREIREAGIGATILMPMVAGANVVGALAFVNDAGGRRFDSGDFELAREIARRAGIAVENARLADQRAEVARVLQRGLLPPRLPAMAGWEAATMYRPAGEVNEVGGDFYDAFEVEGGWMIVLGDVVGRGAAAAAQTALARYTLRTAGMLTGDPRTALRLLHDALRGRRDQSLCTVATVILPRSSEPAVDALVCAAGHPLPLRIRNGEVEAVGRPGALLGAFDAPDWQVTPVELRADDQLAIYTDGVIEARGERERFGEERLRERLAGSGRPARAIARVEAALESFLPAELEDDAAMVVVRRAPGETRAPAPEGTAATARV